MKQTIPGHFPEAVSAVAADQVFPTAPSATPAAAHPTSPVPAAPAIDAPPEASSSQPPPSPSARTPPASPLPVAAGQPSRRNSVLRRGFGGAPDSFPPQSPFRTRRTAAQLPLRRLAPARLWNPTNSTPRTLAPPAASAGAGRPRRQSTPPPPPVPLSRPTLDVTGDPIDLPGSSAGDYPLLPLRQQRQPRQPAISNRASLHLDRSAGAEQRVSLPPSLRHSYDEKRVSPTPSPATEEPEAGPSRSRHQAVHLIVPSEARRFRSRGSSFTRLQGAIGLSFRPGTSSSRHQQQHHHQKEDKGKGKAVIMSHPTPDHPIPAHTHGDGDGAFPPDLERGPNFDATGPLPPRLSTASRLSGIGSALSSSNSSILGDPDAAPADAAEAWGPQHPCYPHLNPHVPLDSPEYATTRIIRVRRDWLLEGDLAPTFSNLYPDILDPAGVSEGEFRRVIDKLNRELVPIFSPFAWRNVVDNVLGLATGWLWDDLGFTAAKSRLRALERWIEQWNEEMEKAAVSAASAGGVGGGEEGVGGGGGGGVIPPKIVPLRRTGYMTLDIQIPDPELAPASPTTATASRDGPDSLPEPPAATSAVTA